MSNKSADSTCSANNSGTLRCAEQSSPSSTHPSLSPAQFHVIQSVPKVHASTTVTTRFTSANSVAGCFIILACCQLSLTATGSATPLSSTTMASKSRPSMSRSMLVSNSSAREQQAHPFCSSTVDPSLNSAMTSPPAFPPPNNRASILTEATSFTITPTLIPSRFSSKFLSAVVFPLPKKPDSSVTGTGFFFSTASASIEAAAIFRIARGRFAASFALATGLTVEEKKEALGRTARCTIPNEARAPANSAMLQRASRMQHARDNMNRE
mmetsp:Transcript_25643/g.46428  ORF Transcript_25643/g.46428 Transcript_25643/m.46428 type:complete len:268 (+) Transcript_25643:290-1093(+)